MVKTFKAIILLSLLVILLSGCTNIRTRNQYHEPLLANMGNSNFTGAIAILEETKEKSFSKKDRVLYYLYLGVLEHYNQDYEKSNATFSKAELGIEELYTKSVSRAATSMLLNDNTFAYSGEDFEDIYINIFKALNYIALEDNSGAFVEIRRVNEKLNLLEDKYNKYADEINSSDKSKIKVEHQSNNFNNSALARYLSLLLYRAENSMDDAAIDKKYLIEAFKLQAKIYDFKHPSLDNILNERRGVAKLNLISFAGLAPTKSALTYRVATLPNQIVVFYEGQDQADGNAMLFPGIEGGNYFKFSVPQLKESKSQVKRIEVKIDGKQIGLLSKIEDVNNIAKETFKMKQPMTYTRAVTRTVLKGIAAIAIQNKVEEQTGQLGGFLAKVGTAAATEASEAADLRSCIAFPGFAYVGDFEVAPGNYTIDVNYLNSAGTLLYKDTIENYQVKSDGLNLVESFYLK